MPPLDGGISKVLKKGHRVPSFCLAPGGASLRFWSKKVRWLLPPLHLTRNFL